MAKKKESDSTMMVDDAAEFFKKELGAVDREKVETFISTGSTLLDYAISNRKNGGVPAGRITEICGNEATGKSLIAYHIMANTQKMGGVAFYIDTERAYNQEFMKRMGIKTDKQFVLANPIPSSIEEVFDYIEKVVQITRLKFPKKEIPITIVWDSVASTPGKEELENAHTGTARLGTEARAMSRSMRKAMSALDDGFVTLVCINQLREKMNASWGDSEVTPHGKALPFYASVRIKLKSFKQIKDTQLGRTVGVSTQAKVFKNKVAPPYRTADFPLYFDWGVDNEASWMDFMKDFSYVKTSGPWSTITIDGNDFKFQGYHGWKDLLKKEPSLRKFVLEKIDEHMTFKFDRKPESITIDQDSILEVEQLHDDIEERKLKSV